MHRVRHHDRIDDGLDRLGDERLQRVTLDRQPHAGHIGKRGRVSGGDDRDLLRLDEALHRIDPGDLAAVAANAGHLAVLDEIDARRIGAAREAPGHRVVPRHAAAPLKRGTEHRIAAVEVDGRLDFLDLLRREVLGIHAVEPVRIDAALRIAHVLQRMREVHHAALAEHDVVVEILREPFPKLHRLFVKRGRFVPEIVRADDRRVARRVAAAEPAFFEHGDVAHAMLLRQVVGRGEPVPASAHDDDVILALRLGAAPLALPMLVVRQAVAHQAEYRIAAHSGDPCGLRVLA